MSPESGPHARPFPHPWVLWDSLETVIIFFPNTILRFCACVAPSLRGPCSAHVISLTRYLEVYEGGFGESYLAF